MGIMNKVASRPIDRDFTPREGRADGMARWNLKGHDRPAIAPSRFC